jgi:hypothetical protein
MVDLKIKIARFNLKKPGEVNYRLWSMLVKPIQRVNLTFAWIWQFYWKVLLLFFNKFSCLYKCCMVVYQILLWIVWLIPIKIETCIWNYWNRIETNIYYYKNPFSIRTLKLQTTSKSLWLLCKRLLMCYIGNYKKLLYIKNFS